MLWNVRPIVYNDIPSPETGNSPHLLGIALVRRHDSSRAFYKVLAPRININSGNAGMGQIVFPDLQAATMRYAYLKKRAEMLLEFAYVAVIHREIMVPAIYKPSLMGIEAFCKGAQIDRLLGFFLFSGFFVRLLDAQLHELRHELVQW